MTVVLDLADGHEMNGVAFEYTVSDLSDILEEFYSQTEKIVNDVLSLSGWDSSSITDVVLQRGSSKLSVVSEKLINKFQRAVC